MSGWDNTIDCDFRGCPMRFPAHQLPHQRHCIWHGDQADEPALTETLASRSLKGLSA